MQTISRMMAGAGTVLLTLSLLCLAHADAEARVTQDYLSPTEVAAGSVVTATLRLRSPSCIRVLWLGVEVRDEAGENLDFPGWKGYVRICPEGLTITTGPRTFSVGTYHVFGLYKDITGYHQLTSMPMTVSAEAGSPLPLSLGSRMRLAWSEEFSSPIAWGTRWVGNRTSAYQYADHNPNDDKLDWLTTSDVVVSGGVATFTAQPSRHRLENGRQAWTTGLITTEGSAEGFRVRTGDYVETRVLLPSGFGAWPALWTWKNGGNEVDSYEYHPDNPSLLELSNRVHLSDDYYQNPASIAPSRWVTIGVRYGATSVGWYVNGVKVFADGTGVGNNWSAYLILNLSVDAGLYHPPPQNSSPISFAADYIRVWR